MAREKNSPNNKDDANLKVIMIGSVSNYKDTEKFVKNLSGTEMVFSPKTDLISCANKIKVKPDDVVLIATHGNAFLGEDGEERFFFAGGKDGSLDSTPAVKKIIEFQKKTKTKLIHILACRAGAISQDIERDLQDFADGTVIIAHASSKYTKYCVDDERIIQTVQELYDLREKANPQDKFLWFLAQLSLRSPETFMAYKIDRIGKKNQLTHIKYTGPKIDGSKAYKALDIDIENTSLESFLANGLGFVIKSDGTNHRNNLKNYTEQAFNQTKHSELDHEKNKATDDPLLRYKTIGIYMAIERNNLERVKYYLDQGADINGFSVSSNYTYISPLNFAQVLGRSTDIVLYLLEQGKTTIHFKNYKGGTILHSEISENGSLDSFKSLFELVQKRQSKCGDEKNADGRTPLLLAALYGRKDIIEYLLIKKQVDYKAKDNKGRTLPHLVVLSKRNSTTKLSILEMLTQLPQVKDLDWNAKDKKGWTPLHFAFYHNQKDIIEYLRTLDQVECNAVDEDGITTNQNWLELLRFSLSNELQNIETLLCEEHIEDSGLDKEEIKMLLESSNSTNQNIKSSNITMHPLHLACQLGYEDVAELLIQTHNEDVNSEMGKEGITPLDLACMHGQLTTVKLLLNEGANLNGAGFLPEMTPVHRTAIKGHKDIMELLCKKGGSSAVNATSFPHLYTPLHYACLHNHSNVAKVLIENGANLTAKDAKGNTPLNIADEKYKQDENYKPIFLLLKQPTQNLHKPDDKPGDKLDTIDNSVAQQVSNTAKDSV